MNAMNELLEWYNGDATLVGIINANKLGFEFVVEDGRITAIEIGGNK